jgi:alpha-1,2-mannosyltransferase
MIPLARRRAVAIEALCGFFGFAGWSFYAAAFAHHLGQDWMVFYNASGAYLEGNLPLLFHGADFTARINEQLADWLSAPLSFHPWMYPPTFLLFVVPFGGLPFPIAYASFLLVTGAALIAAVWYYDDDPEHRKLLLGLLMLSPAVACTVVLGQNSFLTSAVLIGGFALMKRQPILGGTVLGILSFKPQLALMVPIALIAGRYWQSLAGAAASALLLAFFSLVVFGLDAWRGWVALMTVPSDLYNAWNIVGRLHGQSVYTCVALLGASPAVANAAQAIAIVLAAGGVYWCFRQAVPHELQLMMLLAATMLSAPHVFNYDGVMLDIAASLLLCRALNDGFRFGELIVIPLTWVNPLINPPILFPVGLITPLVIGLFMACIIARGRSLARAPGNSVLYPA